MAILTYMLEYVDGTDILDKENMRDGYKQFYHAFEIPVGHGGWLSPHRPELANELRLPGST
jgi:hypothetical protein